MSAATAVTEEDGSAPAVSSPLPWHRAEMLHQCARFASGRAPHALLIAGPAGSGKTRFALALSAALGCEATADRQPCGACRACRRFAAASPDHRLVAPEPDKRQILVEAARELLAFMALTTHSAAVKTAVIVPAEAMHRSAANALLKTLEEPAGAALLLLVAHAPGQVPATIRSRCERLVLAKPARADALEFVAREARCSEEEAARCLALSSGRVLHAVATAGDGIAARKIVVDGLLGLRARRVAAGQVAASWEKNGIDVALQWLPTLMLDVSRLRLGGGAVLMHADASAGLTRLADGLDFDRWSQAAERVGELRRLRAAGSAFNPLLALEALTDALQAAMAGD